MTNEKDIIEGCKRKNGAAQELLYRKHFGAMYNYVLYFISDKESAIEVINNTFMKVFSKIDSFLYEDSFEGWLMTVLKNTILDHIRDTKKYRDKMVFDYPDNLVGEDPRHAFHIEELFSLLENLPPTTRKIFELYAIEGFTHAEIAKEANISEVTSRWHVSNARTALKKIINQS